LVKKKINNFKQFFESHLSTDDEHREFALGRYVVAVDDKVFAIDENNRRIGVNVPKDRLFKIIDLDYKMNRESVMIKLRDEKGQFKPWFPLSHFKFVDENEDTKKFDELVDIEKYNL